MNYFLKPGASQTLALSSSVATAAAFFDHGVVARLVSSVDCWVRIATGTQTGTTVAQGIGLFLPAGRSEYFRVIAGDVVTAIPDTASSGTLNIVEMA